MKWRANIGLISPAQSVAETAFNRYAPDGVEIATTRIRLKATPDEADDGFVPRLKLAAEVFRGIPKDVILFGCTIGSCINGYGWDQECIRMVEECSGSPATTTITACVDAFHALEVKRIAMLTPYPAYRTQIQKEFLEAHGFEVPVALSMKASETGAEVTQESLYGIVKQMDLSGADAVFISCMKLHTMEILEPLEQDLHLPVVSSSSASLWSVLQKSHVGQPIENAGLLLRMNNNLNPKERGTQYV